MTNNNIYLELCLLLLHSLVHWQVAWYSLLGSSSNWAACYICVYSAVRMYMEPVYSIYYVLIFLKFDLTVHNRVGNVRGNVMREIISWSYTPRNKHRASWPSLYRIVSDTNRADRGTFISQGKIVPPEQHRRFEIAKAWMGDDKELFTAKSRREYPVWKLSGVTDSSDANLVQCMVSTCQSNVTVSR